MAFKMKAGKEGPMQKNFGSALNANKFLGELAAAREKGDTTFDVGGKTFNVEGSAKPKLKDSAPMMRMDNSAMKAMGKPAPVKMSHPMKQDDGSSIPLGSTVQPDAAKDPNHPNHLDWVAQNLVRYGPGSNAPYSSVEEYIEKTGYNTKK
jgi:hypothetical protein